MKTQNLLRSIFGVAVIAVLLSVVSCDSTNNPSALVGRWVLVEGPTRGNPEDIELLSDGTGVVDKMGITWKSENDRVFLTNPLFAGIYNYKISGSVLTLTNDKDTILKYANCKKDCKKVAEAAAVEAAAAAAQAAAQAAAAAEAAILEQARQDSIAEAKRK